MRILHCLWGLLVVCMPSCYLGVFAARSGCQSMTGADKPFHFTAYTSDVPGQKDLKYSITAGSEGSSSTLQQNKFSMKNAQGQQFDCLIPHTSELVPPEQLPQV